jgi:hypothetical protein
MHNSVSSVSFHQKCKGISLFGWFFVDFASLKVKERLSAFMRVHRERFHAIVYSQVQ